jgi:hypothetical protein
MQLSVQLKTPRVASHEDLEEQLFAIADGIELAPLSPIAPPELLREGSISEEASFTWFPRNTR